MLIEILLHEKASISSTNVYNGNLKQNALGKYNEDFGDELYMIEEHTSEGHSEKASFGFQNDLDSTDDMLKKIRKDEDIIVDAVLCMYAKYTLHIT